MFLSSSAPVHVRTHCPVPLTATVQTCVLKYEESVVMGSFAVSVCCTLVHVPSNCCCDYWCGARVFTCTHTQSKVWYKSEEFVVMARLAVTFRLGAQPAVCCTNFLSAWGRRRWVCDHVISRAHLYCKPFVTIYCVGVSADTNCVVELYLGSCHMIAHTHVCYRRHEFVVAVCICAYVSVFECASTCAAEASKHRL